MSKASIAIAAVFAASISAFAEATPQSTLLPIAKLQPFLQTYCVRCHGPQEQNGQTRFDQISWEITNNDEAQRWQDVLDVLNGGDMPPEEARQPANDELARTLDVLTGALLKARRRLTDHGGEITMRRLNRREYVNTIRQLFGFNISPDLIPEDGEAESFDTVGADQFFNSSHFEKYLELGREIGVWAFTWSGKPYGQVTTSRREPEERVTDRLRETLADLDRKMAMKKAGRTWKEMGFKDEGEAQIVFSQFDNRAGKPRRYLQYPHVENGIYMCEVNNETRRFGMNRGIDPRASYRFRVRGGVVGEPPAIRQFLRFSDNTGSVGVVRMKGTPEEPETVELMVPAMMPYRVQSFHMQENRADIRVLDQYLRRLDPEGEWAALWIDWLEMEGPYYDSDEPDSVFGKLIYPDGYVRGKRPHLLTDQGARELIEKFAFEAFRHQPPSSDYVDQLLALFEKNRAEGQPHSTAMSEVIGIILASPDFLFLREADPDTEKSRQLTDRELAIRLSYFLWSAPPDEELYSLAESQGLSNPDELSRQIDRMLEDPRADAFFDGFMSQWAELDRFDAITVDELKYFQFNKGVRLAARREVSEFFRTLVREDLSVSNLIDSDFVVVNSVLAEHYEIEGVTSDEYQKVGLPADSPRGGLLTQSAFLTIGSNGERSSPVIRGALVMEKLLHDKPAPPPPNVPELGAASDKPATNRQMVELHQRRAVCASCHKKMDVIGFGLENFDPIGRWRETEKVGRRDVPIETGGVLPDGSEFADVQSLKRVLLQQKSAVAREILEALLTYGVGRSIEFSDIDDVDAIMAQLEQDDYRMRSMIRGIVVSRIFQSK